MTKRDGTSTARRRRSSGASGALSLFAFLLALFLLPAWTTPPAVAQEALGEVSFPNSGAAEAQEPFRRGLLLLHSFEYQDARDAFLEAQHRDPAFAMAYWGEALTYDHPLWGDENLEAAREALDELDAALERASGSATLEPSSPTSGGRPPTPREAAYIDAVSELFGEGTKAERDARYAEAMGRLAEAHPADADAAALYALALLGTAENGRDFSVYMKAAAVLEELIDRHPRHPGALHYMIHAYDDPVHAPLGLRAARAYADVAADAVHALHMPSHIFFALGMWDDVARMNERSWQASIDRAEPRDLGPGAYSYHALWWLHYAYLQQDRTDEAMRLLAAADDALRESGARTVGYHRAQMRAAQIVDDPAHAIEAGLVDAALADTAGGPLARASNLLAGGLALVATGRIDEAQRVSGRLREVAERARQFREQAGRGAGDVPRMSEMLLRGALLIETGEGEEGLSLLREAAAIEASLPYEFGPPLIVKPASELLGEVLLAHGERAEAAAAFEKALERAPGRRLSVRGLEKARAAP